MCELLKDRIAVVTGAARGIGKAISTMMTEQGATVVLIDMNEKLLDDAVKEIQAPNPKTRGIALDLTDLDIINPTLKSITDEFGRIDIWVNNAGFDKPMPLEKLTPDVWDRTMDVNLKSLFFWSQSVIEIMKAQKYGRFINLSSMAGLRGGRLSGVDYAASKSGVLGVSRSLALHGAEYGITSNAICPGLIDTDIIELTDEQREALRSSVPMGRLGVPRDVGDLAVFLASDMSSYITGTYVSINGGLHINN